MKIPNCLCWSERVKMIVDCRKKYKANCARLESLRSRTMAEMEIRMIIFLILLK